MYVSSNIFDKACRYIDLPDREFFLQAIAHAEALNFDLDADAVKRLTPIAHITKLSKQTKAEDVVDRRYVHTDRARRSFIMGDVDFDPGQEAESKRLRSKLIGLANKHRTPILVYPTVSAPEKPRFRFVFLTQRVMTASQYYQAMSWVYQQVGEKPTDASDLRMSSNRNLPLFTKEEQLSLVYSTFDQPSKQPLDNALWKDIPKPSARILELDADALDARTEAHSVKLDKRKVLEGARLMMGTPITKSYERFWMVVNSFAATVLCGGCDVDTAEAALDILAEAGDDSAQVERWRRGNREMLGAYMSRLSSDSSQLGRARPLLSWAEFSNARAV